MTAPMLDHVTVGRRHFGGAWSPALTASAPGRIELIGNHLDYNGGPVLAAAIDRRIRISAHIVDRAGISAVFSDIDPDSVVTLGPDDLGDWRSAGEQPTPENFLCGVIASLYGRHLPVRTGLQMVVSGNLPHGVGISSSAALCVALTMAVCSQNLDRSELVLIAQEAENRTGSPCGTMDQSASVFGNVIRFDGSTNEVITLAADLGTHEFIIANSGIVRSLAMSSYPTRVMESRTALDVINQQPESEIHSLAMIDTNQLDAVHPVLKQSGHESLFRRVRHIVTETERVHSAANSLESGDWAGFGALMTESGRSSAIDYEISHPDVEELVSTCLGVSGVLGARMMGGGEGGSVLILARLDSRSALEQRMSERYYTPRGLNDMAGLVFPCRFDHGAFVAVSI